MDTDIKSGQIIYFLSVRTFEQVTNYYNLVWRLYKDHFLVHSCNCRWSLYWLEV